MVVVADPSLVPRGVAHRLDATDEAKTVKGAQRVVDSLQGQRSHPGTRPACDLLGGGMAASTHGGEHGESRRGDPKSRPT